jgi:hypothetical protein
VNSRKEFLKDTSPMNYVCEFFRRSHEWLPLGFRVSVFWGFSYLGLLESPNRGAVKRPLKVFL